MKNNFKKAVENTIQNFDRLFPYDENAKPMSKEDTISWENEVNKISIKELEKNLQDEKIFEQAFDELEKEGFFEMFGEELRSLPLASERIRREYENDNSVIEIPVEKKVLFQFKKPVKLDFS